MSEFVIITKNEFESFISTNFSSNFVIVNSPLSKEFIYDIPTKDSRIALRIYSSVDIRTLDTRNIGEDAIRCVLIDVQSGKPIDKGKRTHRMTNWKERLLEKTLNIQEQINDLKFCKSCGSVMQPRKNGTFFGCIRYPICMVSLSLDGRYREKVISEIESSNNKIVKCPQCNSAMKKRSGSRGEFYGCSKFPGCRGTRKVESVEIYGEGVEKQTNEEVDEEFEEIKSDSISMENIDADKKQYHDIPTDDSQVELIPTANFPHLKFKYENFNPVQSRVFQYYDKDINLIVAASTSAGKTAIAEMLMSDSISNGKKAAFLSPLKAVSQEK
jgi:ssDNA-binding Zn-finger/Zn-ribbon topoisomerase 1